MTTNLLTYDHSHAGSTSILVEVPGIPVRINIFNFPHARVRVELQAPPLGVVQVGPDGRHGTGVKVRAVSGEADATQHPVMINRSGRQVAASNSGGVIIQVAGDMAVGGGTPGLDLEVPQGSFLDMRDHGTVVVVRDREAMSLEDAHARGLIDVRFKNEL